MAGFWDDPYQRNAMLMAMSGGFANMGGTPRAAGWSAPLGQFSKGLASMMPYLMQAQQYSQEQQRGTQEAEQLHKLMEQFGPNNPYRNAGAGISDAGLLEKMYVGGLGYKSEDAALKQVWDPTSKSMIWVSEKEAAGRSSDLPIDEQIKKQIAGRAGGTTIQMPKSIEERDQQILITGDPASPQYAMAYARTFLNPDFVAGTDAQGRPIQTPIYLPVPPNIRKPTYMGEQPAQAAPAVQPQAGVAASQTPSGPSTGAPLVVGESTARNSPELRKLEQGFSRVGQSVKRYRQNLEDYGEGPTLKITDPGQASLLEQGYNDLMLEAKNLYDLGVLNGPDYQIMTTTLTPPTSAKAAFIAMPTFVKQLDAFDQKLRDAEASAKAIYAPSTATPQPAGGDDVQTLLDKPADQWTDEDRRKAEELLK